MSRKLVHSAPMPRRRPSRALTVVAALILALAIPLLLALQSTPRAAGAPPDAATARDALAAGQDLRAFIESGASEGRLTLSAAEINALLASAARVAPGVAGATRLTPDRIAVDLSLGAPWLPAGLWANLSLGVAAPADRLRIVSARLGRLPLPPALVEAALARGLDRAIGEPGSGRALLAGVVGVAVEGDAAMVDIAFAPGEGESLADRLRARLNFAAGGANLEPIRAQLYWLHRAGVEGAVGPDGSVAPFLRAIIDRAERQATRYADLPDRELAAAGLLALALYCGEPALAPAIGVGPTEAMRGDANTCSPATLGGRDDFKRHFAVSAGLYAASTAVATFGIGELKELLDSGSGGSGFSFDDLAADLAGARFAATLLATPEADWPALRARITDESDILPETADLPTRLSAADFEAQFGDVDSPEYAAMIAEITRRVDALPFHSPAPGG